MILVFHQWTVNYNDYQIDTSLNFLSKLNYVHKCFKAKKCIASFYLAEYPERTTRFSFGKSRPKCIDTGQDGQNFPSIRSVACWLAELNSAPCRSRAEKEKQYTLLNGNRIRQNSNDVPLHHDGLLVFQFSFQFQFKVHSNILSYWIHQLLFGCKLSYKNNNLWP